MILRLGRCPPLSLPEPSDPDSWRPSSEHLLLCSYVSRHYQWETTSELMPVLLDKLGERERFGFTKNGRIYFTWVSKDWMCYFLWGNLNLPLSPLKKNLVSISRNSCVPTFSPEYVPRIVQLEYDILHVLHCFYKKKIVIIFTWTEQFRVVFVYFLVSELVKLVVA